jgi:hypothetical protein
VALFSKPAYKIMVLGKSTADNFGNNNETKNQIDINDPSNNSVSEFLEKKQDDDKFVEGYDYDKKTDDGRY